MPEEFYDYEDVLTIENTKVWVTLMNMMILNQPGGLDTLATTIYVM